MGKNIGNGDEAEIISQYSELGNWGKVMPSSLWFGGRE